MATTAPCPPSLQSHHQGHAHHSRLPQLSSWLQLPSTWPPPSARNNSSASSTPMPCSLPLPPPLPTPPCNSSPKPPWPAARLPCNPWPWHLLLLATSLTRRSPVAYCCPPTGIPATSHGTSRRRFKTPPPTCFHSAVICDSYDGMTDQMWTAVEGAGLFVSLSLPCECICDNLGFFFLSLLLFFFHFLGNTSEVFRFLRDAPNEYWNSKAACPLSLSHVCSFIGIMFLI